MKNATRFLIFFLACLMLLSSTACRSSGGSGDAQPTNSPNADEMTDVRPTDSPTADGTTDAPGGAQTVSAGAVFTRGDLSVSADRAAVEIDGRRYETEASFSALPEKSRIAFYCGGDGEDRLALLFDPADLGPGRVFQAQDLSVENEYRGRLKRYFKSVSEIERWKWNNAVVYQHGDSFYTLTQDREAGITDASVEITQYEADKHALLYVRIELTSGERFSALCAYDLSVGAAPSQQGTVEPYTGSGKRCSKCGGAKTVARTCPLCYGNKEKDCMTCLGKKTVPCDKCGGDGWVYNLQMGRDQRCGLCNNGKKTCGACKGSGKRTCEVCGGSGELRETCGRCLGSGKEP